MFKTIKIFAVIDLLLGILLTLPFIGVWVIQLMHSLVSVQPLLINDFHASLLKILGLMTILWAMVRLQHTAVWQVNFDSITRVFILAVMGFYAYQGLTVLSFFMLSEFIGLYQLYALKQHALKQHALKQQS